MKFIIEVSNVPGLVLNVSIKADPTMLHALAAVGVEGVELQNMIKARLDDVVQALDGSVRGLIVSNLEY
jgi:hypothetical protein